MSIKANTAEQTLAFLTAEEDQDKRLDQFFAENTDLSRTFCQKLIKSGAALVNQKPISKVASILQEYQEVTITIPESKELSILPEDISVEILYEDADVLVINKPAGMVVHPDDTYTSGTLVNALLHILGAAKLSGIGGVKRPGIVHRLDKDTSGVMIVAKHDQAHRFLSEQIAERKVTKWYKTLVFGRVKHDKFSIDSPILRDPKDRQKMSVSGAKNARSALTHVELESVFQNPLCSLLNVNIITGRTHQIRVHLSSVGYPVVGDPVYGNQKLNAEFAKELPLERIFLHAYSLKLVLPNGEEKEFIAPLAHDLAVAEEILKF